MWILQRELLAINFLLVAHALDSSHRLVRVWDQLTFFEQSTGSFVGSWNMTSFPYIDGVSLTCLKLIYIPDFSGLVWAKLDADRLYVFRDEHHPVQQFMQQWHYEGCRLQLLDHLESVWQEWLQRDHRRDQEQSWQECYGAHLWDQLDYINESNVRLATNYVRSTLLNCKQL